MKDISLVQTAIFMSGINTIVTAIGMLSENLQRMHRGESMAYCEDSFQEMLDRNGFSLDTIKLMAGID